MSGKKKEQQKSGENETTEDRTGEQDDAGKVEFTPEQQQHIDRIISDRLTRAEEKYKRDQEAADEKAKAEAEAERLKEQQKWQELAEQREANIQELEQEKQALEEKARTMHVRRSVEAKAAELEFERPPDAYNLLLVEGKLSEVEIAEDGETTGFETALEELAKSGRLPMKKKGGSGLGTPRRTASRPAPATSPQVPERPLAKL